MFCVILTWYFCDVLYNFAFAFRLHQYNISFLQCFHDITQKNIMQILHCFFSYNKHWFLSVLLGCHNILIDVIVCKTLWYFIIPIRRLLKIAFCEITLCSQYCMHVKDYVSKTHTNTHNWTYFHLFILIHTYIHSTALNYTYYDHFQT